MAQHEQLDVLDINAPAASGQQLQQRYKGEVDERHGHRTILSGHAKPAITPNQSFGSLHGAPVVLHGSDEPVILEPGRHFGRQTTRNPPASTHRRSARR